MDHGGRRERDEVFSMLRRKARVRRHGYNSTHSASKRMRIRRT